MTNEEELEMLKEFEEPIDPSELISHEEAMKKIKEKFGFNFDLVRF